MARNVRSAVLETRSARLKLARRGKPYWTKLARGLSLGYRRISTAGPWIVRSSDGKGGNRIQNFAIADDYEEANGDSVLTFWEAQAAARTIASGGKVSGRAITVDAALDRYADELRVNGGNRVQRRLGAATSPRLAPVQSRPASERGRIAAMAKFVSGWADQGDGKSHHRPLSAALSLAARLDNRISNRSWKEGLRKLHGANVGRARNIVLTAAADSDAGYAGLWSERGVWLLCRDRGRNRREEVAISAPYGGGPARRSSRSDCRCLAP